MSREKTLDLIRRMQDELRTAPDAESARLSDFAIHGAARLATALGIITFEEWQEIDKTSQSMRKRFA